MIAQPAIGRVGIHASVLARRAFGHRPELVTLSSTSPSALFLHLKHRLADHKSPNVIVYALPTSLPSTTIPFFLDLVRSSASSSVGLLSSPLPPSANAPELRHSIAIATLDSKNCRVFRSERKGRPKVSVGRWRPFGEADSSLVDGHQQVATAAGDGDWSKVWNPLHEETDSIGSDGPAHLSSIAGLEGVEPDQVSSIVVFTTPPAASPLLQDLHDAYPSSSRTGLIAPPTPFVTGRPFTLFLNDSTLDDGAVGLALLRPDPSSATATEASVAWSELEPLDDTVCEVKESQGNLLLRMHAASPSSASSRTISPATPNPTQHLISLLAASTLPSLTNAAIGASWLGGKDKDFYLGFLDTGSDDKIRRVVRILSGDPKRGGMALDTEDSVQVGDRFLFLHRRAPESPQVASASSGSPRFPFFDLATVPEQIAVYLSDRSEQSKVHVEEGIFRAGSEAGFVFGQPGMVGWVDGGVPSGRVQLAFPSEGV